MAWGGPSGFWRKAYSDEWYIVTLIQLPRLSAVVTEEEYRRVARFVRGGAARSVAELVRLAVTEYTRKAGIVKLVNLRDVPMSEARRAVERYLKKHPGAVWPDEMAEELGIDYRLVLAVVRKLLAEKKVEESTRRVEEIPA
jgi:hypothetical protein